jgi:hypothetical protein
MEPSVEGLAAKVHEGWMAEKQRQGFADHAYSRRCWDRTPGRCAFAEDRHHTDMLPYPELPEHVKEYDRATVRAVLGALRTEGYDIVRAAA